MNISVKSYVWGFIISALLVLVAFGMTERHLTSNHYFLSHSALRFGILLLACLQALVQLRFFLHLGADSESKNGWKMLFVTFVLILIIVAGSIWIMDHLNYNMMPQQMNDYMMHSENMFK